MEAVTNQEPVKDKFEYIRNRYAGKTLRDQDEVADLALAIMASLSQEGLIDDPDEDDYEGIERDDSIQDAIRAAIECAFGIEENKEETPLEKKLRDFVNKECDYAEKNGSAIFTTCSHWSYDQDIWRHRDAIFSAIRSRGHSVSAQMNHGVLDVTITKRIEL